MLHLAKGVGVGIVKHLLGVSPQGTPPRHYTSRGRDCVLVFLVNADNLYFSTLFHEEHMDSTL